jgi:hypothetical protein
MFTVAAVAKMLLLFMRQTPKVRPLEKDDILRWIVLPHRSSVLT